MLAGRVITGGVVSAGGPKAPGGGVACPRFGMGFPQQATVPSVWIPQVNEPPDETSMKVPGGGEAWP
jgi:hypothetical protein